MEFPGSKPRRPLGLYKNAVKHKHSFIQFFAMTGILLLSMRSVSHKYRIHSLHEENEALKEEHQTISDRFNTVKKDLIHEASLEPTGLFASRLRLLFGQD